MIQTSILLVTGLGLDMSKALSGGILGLGGVTGLGGVLQPGIR